MVSQDDRDDLKQLALNQYFDVISITILFYDYLITLPDEVERFWTIRCFSWASFLFFLNRYLSIIGYIPILFGSFWNTSDMSYKAKTCHLFQTYHQFLMVLVQIVIGVVLIMRIYAMYNRDRRIIWLFVGIAGTDVAVGIWAITGGHSVALPLDSIVSSYMGCSSPLTNTQGAHLAAAWSGQMLYDAVIFFLTIHKSFRVGRKGGHTLLGTIFRDGSFYFAIMTLANLANILTFLLAPTLTKGVTSTISNIISSTMTSRLMLNLRDPRVMGRSRSRVEATTDLEGHTTSASEYPMVTTFVEGEASVTHIYEYEPNDIELVARCYRDSWDDSLPAK